MALLPDPAALETVARHITGHADDLRGRASRLASAAETVRWRSPAAAVFRGDVCDLASAYRRAAGEVDDAAHALRRHAAAVRHAEAAIRAAERAVAAVEHAATAAVHGVKHLLGL
jgi:uncharacterized protein YukE